MNKIEQAIDFLKNNSTLNSLGLLLEEEYINCGKPEEANGPSIEVKIGMNMVDYPDEINDYTIEAMSNITYLKEKAIEAVGYTHIGGNIIHTQRNNSDEFSKYQDFGMDIIIDWFIENEPYMY